jgi:IclR family transcriptional regulator, acetate operon repressor
MANGGQDSRGTVSKCLSILDVVSASDQPLRFASMMRITGLPRSTLHRLLTTLQAERLLTLDATTKTYRSGPRLLGWVNSAWHDDDLRRVAHDEVAYLGRETGETVHLAILDGHEIVYVDKIESSQSIRMYSRIGKRAPIHCTGVGKALVAFLPPDLLEAVIEKTGFEYYTPTTITDVHAFREHLAQIREVGYATDMGEHQAEVRCIAAPVLNQDRHGIASISISTPAYRYDPERCLSWAPMIVASAHRISHELGMSERP